MKETQADIAYQFLTDMVNFIENEEKEVSTQADAIGQEKREFENRCRQQDARIGGQYNEAASMYQARLNEIYGELSYLAKEVDKQIRKASLSDKLLKFVKVERSQKTFYASRRIEVHSIEECNRAIEELRAEYQQLNGRYGTYSSAFSGGYSAYKNGGDNDDTRERLEAFHGTLVMLMNNLRMNSREIVDKEAGRQRVDAVKQSIEIKKGREEERKAIEERYDENSKALEQKIKSDVESVWKAHIEPYYQIVTQLPAEKIWINYSMNNILQTDQIENALKEKCPWLIQEKKLTVPINLTMDHDTPLWMFMSRNEEQRAAVEAVMETVMLSAMITIPAKSLRFVEMGLRQSSDHRGIRSNIYKYQTNLPDDIVCNNTATIKEQLKRLNQTGEHTGSETTVLMFHDFPNGLDDESMQLLEQLIKNGKERGIYTVLSCQSDYVEINEEDQTEEYRMKMERIVQQAECLVAENNYFLWRKIPCAIRTYNAEQKERVLQNALIFNLRKEQPDVLPDVVYKTMQGNLDATIELVNQRNYYSNTYANELQTENVFPEQMFIGGIDYPSGIFRAEQQYRGQLEHQGESLPIFDRPEYQNEKLRVPWCVSMRKSMNLYLKGTQAARQSMTAFTHHMIWSFLTYIPVGKLNICVFDSEQRGNSIFPFLSFRKQCPDVFGEKIYTSTEDMYEQLHRINEHINEFIQEKLGGRYKDFLEYNANTPKRSEPATLLIIYDFPGGMDQRILNELTSIISNGNTCGVYTIICHNTDLSYMGYEKLDAYLERVKGQYIPIDCRENSYALESCELDVEIPKKVSPEKMERFIQAYEENVKKLQKQGLEFADILPGELFAADTADRLEIPIGVGDGDQVEKLVMGEKQSHHALIAGATGSGKSTLLHTIIMSSMLKYSPDEMQLYLMDFKSGTEFKIYDTCRLPHIRLLALDAMQEFGESILERLVREMEERADAFKEAGGLTKIRDYVAVTGKKMPRILVVMDEFQILFNDATNRKVAMNCAKLTQRLVTEGRAYGIHLLMATQSTKVIMNLTLSTGTIEQMRIRIGLKCSESDSRYLFGDENCEKALEMMKGATGTAVMNEDYTETKNSGFRVAYCAPDKQREFLDLIAEKTKDFPSQLQVFEGKRTEKLTDSLKEQDASVYDAMPLYIHMGIPIKVAPPYIVKMSKKPKNNLLICCGAKPKMANMVSNDYMISAVMNAKTSVYCMDGNILLDDDYERELYDVLAFHTDRFHLAEDRIDLIKMIDEIYDRYCELRKKRKNEEAIVVVLKNLEYLDIVADMLKGETVRREDYLEEEDSVETASDDGLSDVEKAFGADLFDFLPSEDKTDKPMTSRPELADELIELMDRGAAYGIYFAVSTLDYQTVRETMVMGRNYDKEILKKFPNRIIYSLNDMDAQALIPDVTLNGLADNTVYYTDGFQKRFQLKPFVAPSADELRDFWKM